MSAGKEFKGGRKVNQKKYDSNFETIRWKSNGKKTLKGKERNPTKKE